MNRGEILFLTHLMPYELYDEVSSNSKNNMQDAANALQWHLLEGLSFHLNKKLDLINVMPIASYPRYYSEAFIDECLFDTGLSESNISIGFVNIKLIRKESIYRNLYKSVSRWCGRNDKKKTIIIYSLNASMLKAVAKIKSRYPGIEVCAIVADLPDMMNLSSNKSLVKRILEKISADMAYENIECIDKYVFLTKHMSKYLNNEKPFCVLEGIASKEFEKLETADQDSEIKTILYTGTLHKKFGILNLLEAFSYIKDKNYRLVICGSGDSEEAIKEASHMDSRIIYKGQLSRDEVLKLQMSATVLVNPRLNNEEFTKYSFPSKNLEYLSSGVPLIAYKLDGIPEEYSDYIIYVNSNEPTELAKKIVETASMHTEERVMIGKRARRFVFEQKNPIVQTKKILDLLDC